MLAGERRIVDQRRQLDGAVQDGAVLGAQRDVAASFDRAVGREGQGAHQLEAVLAGQHAVVNFGHENVVAGPCRKAASAQDVGVDAQRACAAGAANVSIGATGQQLDAVALHQRGTGVCCYQPVSGQQRGIAAGADDLAERQAAVA